MKKQYCLGFMVTPDFQHIVLIKKDTDKPEQQWQNGQLNGIGGEVMPGENGVAAMIREFREETGVDTESIGWNYCGEVRDFNSEIYSVACYMTIADRAVLESVKKQENERETPAVYYYPLVKSRYYNIANDVPEIITQCRWVVEHWQKGMFRQFTMLTD